MVLGLFEYPSRSGRGEEKGVVCSSGTPAGRSSLIVITYIRRFLPKGPSGRGLLTAFLLLPTVSFPLLLTFYVLFFLAWVFLLVLINSISPDFPSFLVFLLIFVNSFSSLFCFYFFIFSFLWIISFLLFNTSFILPSYFIVSFVFLAFFCPFSSVTLTLVNIS